MTMNKNRRIALVAAALLACIGSAQSAGSAKDIVIDRVTSPVVTVTPAAPTGDALSVSVLLESPDGSLTPKSTDTVFRTGDRFRIKLLGSRNAKVSLYNTNPRGELGSEPVWRGELKVGQDTISPRLALTGNSGVDQLHVVMEPATDGGLFGWLTNWLNSSGKAGASKDIQLDVQTTPTTTYLVNAAGQGLVTTVKIAHAAN
jgi:hypothetical protein